MDVATALRWLPLVVASVAAVISIHRAVRLVRLELDGKVTKDALEKHAAQDEARFAELESQVNSGRYDAAQLAASMNASWKAIDALRETMVAQSTALERRMEVQGAMLHQNTMMTSRIAGKLGVTEEEQGRA